MKRSSGSALGFYTIGVAALFLAGFFLLVVFGAQSYRNAVAVQSDNNQKRALLGYFETCISANDAKGSVRVSRSEYGDVLEIPDSNDDYGIRIYLYNGELKETYMALDAALEPEMDVTIGKTAVFQAEFPRDGLLKITTDAGSILIRLRSEESGIKS
ncbi:MAG: DUF4860 domain-containing protein [Parasporobacterium sp.]|nr:DUF4860 domain-containing protein [Parasporobacterium sp.]